MLGALIRELFKLRTLVFLFGLIALSLVIWFFGPEFSLMGGNPLASASARIAPMAIRSEPAKIASKGTPPAINRRAASCPECSIDRASTCSLGSTGRPASVITCASPA